MNNKIKQFVDWVNNREKEIMRENSDPIISNFNVESALSQIKKEFPESRYTSMLDEEILSWVDDNWEEDHETEYEYYVDHNNREAEDVVISQMISWYERKNNVKLSQDEGNALAEKIEENY
jgi:hypothetical protein